MPTGGGGPGCGWVLSYIETLMHEYRMDLPTVLRRLRLAAGIVLLEARAARINPDMAIGHVERCIMRARAEVRQWFEAHYDIHATPPRQRQAAG